MDASLLLTAVTVEVYIEATRFILSDVDKKEKTMHYRALLFFLELSMFYNIIVIIVYSVYIFCKYF